MPFLSFSAEFVGTSFLLFFAAGEQPLWSHKRKVLQEVSCMGKVPSVVVGEPTLGLTEEKVHQAAKKLHGKALLWQSLFLLEAAMCSREGGEVTCDK